MQSDAAIHETSDVPELSPQDRARIGAINSTIRAASRSLRERHGWLRHQDVLGLSILFLSALVMIGNGVMYLAGIAPAWVAVLVAAFAASLAHEIEHDLIHKLYFRGVPWMNSAMMALGWLMRPNTINPWIRRKLHLKHHQLSGTPKDLEERAITNGEPFGLKRLLMMADGLLAALLRLDQAGDRKRQMLIMVAASYFPLGWLHFSLWYVFLVSQVALALGLPLPVPVSEHLPLLNAIVVVWLGPNVLRSFCLNFVSSSMHYYGDVAPRNVLQQTQILNPIWMLPLQAFCFNFGSTHAIHHFVANEPFYVRQWTAKEGHAVLIDNGIPHNDVGTFRRANRRGFKVQAVSAVSTLSSAHTRAK